MVGLQVVADRLAVERRRVGPFHRAGDDVDHVLDEVPRVDDPRPRLEAFADEVGLERRRVEKLERGGTDRRGVAVGDVLVGAADRPAGVGDVVDDQHVFALHRALGHRIPYLCLVGFVRRPHVVFHLETGEVVEAEKITDAPAREPAAARERDDHVRLKVGAFHRVRDVSTQPVDVLPVGDGTVEIVREVAHTAVLPTRALIRV